MTLGQQQRRIVRLLEQHGSVFVAAAIGMPLEWLAELMLHETWESDQTVMERRRILRGAA